MSVKQEDLSGSWAWVSECGLYRYSLGREWGSGPRLVVVMLNPSTADALVDDPTVTRLLGRARGSGYGSLEVVNLYGLRATDPGRLVEAADPVGPENDEFIGRAVAAAGSIWVAWGSHPMALKRADVVLESLVCRELWCLGMTSDGHPRHPLYVGSWVAPMVYRRSFVEAGVL